MYVRVELYMHYATLKSSRFRFLMKPNSDLFHVIKVHVISWQKLKFHIHFIILDLTWTVVLEISGYLQCKASTIYTLTQHSASHWHSKNQDRQYTYDVTLRRVRATIVAMDKQYYIFCVFVQHAMRMRRVILSSVAC